MRVLLCGGGTEGHIAPSLALAEKMEANGDAFLFVGRKGGEENKKVLARSYPYLPIDIRSPASYRYYEKPLFLRSLYHSIKESQSIIDSFKPDAIFATGGYVSFPPLFVGNKRNIPIFLHESNAIAGTTCKLLSKYAKILFLGMPGTEGNFRYKKETMYVGTPTREAFFQKNKARAKRKLGFGDEFVILSFGGSLGASKLNEVCLQIMEKYKRIDGVAHIHATGKRYFYDIKNRGEISVFGGKCRAVPFIDCMEDYLLSADVVICRAGAASISEILATGTYPIFIPSPNVKNNHQYHNAIAISKLAQTPVVCEDENLYENLIERIEYVRTHPLEQMKTTCTLRKLSTPECANTILKEIRNVIYDM